jgi:gamma-glutamyltranspeptidase/glutathione hydrolase
MRWMVSQMRGLTTSSRFQRTIVAATYSSVRPADGGLAAMMMLNVLSGYDVGGMTDVDRIHVFAEASKQTNLHRNKLFGDPSVEDVPVYYLLPADWHERARTRIDLSRAQPAVFWPPKPHKDTIYLCVVDVDGSLSLINSLFEPFGIAATRATAFARVVAPHRR